ncbi:flagellar protein FlaG [Dethiobacter alkaliphilus]|uniref:Flagellar protein FlaG protein n=1 Tax=Dethiobacter alkaliphilus AHT 1 TaxID=555088 RepID=C0GJI8_DETAL|nr:flagellar protein FlaG [Dethiobacter alkaliphilus]EEG76535.1 flagellar protein FlaG protein [Dethiobacter alkaliphilus AHT 1]
MRIVTNNPPPQPDSRHTTDVSHSQQAQKKDVAIQGKNPAQEISPQETDHAVEQLNKTSDALNLSLRFKLHEGTDRMMVQVVDTKADEIIKEMPPENLLNVVAQIQNMVGLMLDAKR